MANRGSGDMVVEPTISAVTYTFKDSQRILLKNFPGTPYIEENVETQDNKIEVYSISVEINGRKFIGKGPTKQLARYAAADAAVTTFKLN